MDESFKCAFVGFLPVIVWRVHFSLLLIYSFKCFTFRQGCFKKSISGNLPLYSLSQVPLRKLVPRWSELEKWKLGVNLFPEKMWGERNGCHVMIQLLLHCGFCRCFVAETLLPFLKIYLYVGRKDVSKERCSSGFWIHVTTWWSSK